jgi:ADP-ribose pyrophosphatase
MHFRLLEKEKIYRGSIIELSLHHIQYDSGRKTVREIVEHPGGAVIVPLFDNGDILLVRQYRHPVEQEVLELPAGKLNKGEDPLLCAQRELREETGYEAEEWQKLTTIFSTPGFCDEKLHLYLAAKLSLHPEGKMLEEGELSLQTIRIPLNKAVKMIDQGEILDGKTITAILLAQRKNPIGVNR